MSRCLMVSALLLVGANTMGRSADEADNRMVLSGGNWKLQNASAVSATPEQISRAGFDDHEWIPAIVPGTVLRSYLAIGAIPDPWYGDQISGISDDLFSRNDFWYRNSFTVPAGFADRRVWLNFDGINWKADVFLNGAKLGRIDGAFIRGRFEVTSLLRPGQTNHLAVLIHQVAHSLPGRNKVTRKKIGTPTTNGDQLGADSPTFLASAGWNQRRRRVPWDRLLEAGHEVHSPHRAPGAEPAVDKPKHGGVVARVVEGRPAQVLRFRADGRRSMAVLEAVK